MRRKFGLILLLVAAALVVQPLAATTMLQMDLAELTERANRIFRGTVVDVEQGTVEVGGGELPAVTYRFKVDDLYKGEADLYKGYEAMIEVRMVGSIKEAVQVGDLARFDVFREVPKLAMGSDYLLFSTPESEVGLSVTVGLGQGAFRVFPVDKKDVAVNEFNNMGLGFDGDGPVQYSEIAAKIRALVGR